jgi:multidrug resistance efflux pump
VPIENNQLVKKGDLLFEIDPTTFQATVNLARAELDNMRDIVMSLGEQVDGLKGAVEQRQAALIEAKFALDGSIADTENLRIIYERAKQLRVQGVNSQRDLDNRSTAYQEGLISVGEAREKVSQTTGALAQAKDDLARGLANLGTPGEDNPRLRRAAADLEIAQLNLNFTKGYAPTDGYVTNLQVGNGDTASANQPMLAMIDAHSFYVQAFFRETFIGNFHKGDRAVVTLMSYPDTPLEARVDSIGRGIAQQNGSTGFELLPAVKPTFEWIRLAQRIPVIVRMEKIPDNIELRAGTTASVVIMTGTNEGDRVPPVPRALQ